MKKGKFAIIVIAAVLAFVFLAVFPIATVVIYDMVFGERCETAEWAVHNIDSYEGLELETCEFFSNKGVTLAGYKYSKDTKLPKGVVVMTHGLGGGGHNFYLPVADCFASEGYLVFAFDITGNDNSGGDSVEGMAQGVSDLDCALNYVKSCEEYKGLPIMLFGHSWGAFSSGAVLNLHPDVSAVCMVSGFDKSSDLIYQQGQIIVGPFIDIFMPYVKLYERIKFGDYASLTACEGFENSGARVMIIHSTDDTTVLAKNGYDIFYENHSSDERFVFLEFEDRGHSYILNSDEQRQYVKEFNKEFYEVFGIEPDSETKTAYMKENVDFERYSQLDSELMADIIDFFDGALK